MGKIITSVTLDEGLIKEAKERKIKLSTTLNDLLGDYLGESVGSLEILKQRLSKREIEANKLRVEIEALREKIKEIEAKEKDVREMFKKIPQQIIEDIKEFPKMTLNNLLLRNKEIYKFNDTELLIKCFNEIRGND